MGDQRRVERFSWWGCRAVGRATGYCEGRRRILEQLRTDPTCSRSPRFTEEDGGPHPSSSTMAQPTSEAGQHHFYVRWADRGPNRSSVNR